jgi:hypothetical protein
MRLWCSALLGVVLSGGCQQRTTEGRAGGATPLQFWAPRVPRVLAWPGAHWDSVSSDHFKLYFEPNTYAATHLVSLHARAERAWSDDMALLGLHDYPYPIRIFYFDSKARLDSIFGNPGEGQAYPDGQAVLLVASTGAYETPDDRHEIMHVLSITTWGFSAPENMWESEGLATVAYAPELPYALDAMAAQARRDGDRRSPLDLTRSHFLDGDRMAHYRAYLLSGSFVQYLMRTGGIDRFHQLWERGNGSAAAIYGADLARLVERWNAYLQSLQSSLEPIDLKHVSECRCR